MKQSLSELQEITSGRLIGDDCNFEVLSTDSRNIAKGSLFVALRGERFDGHDFVNTAVQQGAAAIVVDCEQKNISIPQLVVTDTLRALGEIAAQKRQLFKGKVIAVTGSSGKTSVKGMLAKVFSNKGPTLVTAGNFNNDIGVPLTLMRLDDHEFAVIELGTSAPGEIAYLTNLIKPDISVVTNVMPAHIGGFGSLQAIAEEKSCVYAYPSLSVAIVNLDDDFCSMFMGKLECPSNIGFSMAQDSRESCVHAEELHFGHDNLAYFQLCYGADRAPVKLAVPGVHSVRNALAASACALAGGLSVNDIAFGLGEYLGDKGRMQLKQGYRQSTIIDDTYNANLGSVKAAIDVLVQSQGPRVMVLGELGELGEFAVQTHEEIGKYAHEMGVGTLAALGDMAKHAVKAFGEGGIGFDSKAELAEVLKQKYLGSEVTVLVKGSRFTKMEELVDMLVEQAEVKEC